MAPLPSSRVTQSQRPYQTTGIDYFGPLRIKGNVPGETMKVWVCIFTCATTRAIDLDCVTDLSARAFMACLRRFIATNGQPDEIISDNAPHFRLSERTLDLAFHQIFTDNSVFAYCSGQGIRWRFITEYAPWQGGFWERMIGIVKGCMKKAVGRKLLTFDEMITLLSEVSAVVNSRPLTFLYDDFDSGSPLRPIDFLHPLSKVG
ncbi:MAG: transposase family protein, partial [Gammaproteobacteria bacterium]|nr:transposase family protein [Gammaproteobacteria bacterium]